jgi:hypothetical protein
MPRTIVIHGRVCILVGRRYFAVPKTGELTADKLASTSASGIVGNPYERILAQGGTARVISNVKWRGA